MNGMDKCKIEKFRHVFVMSALTKAGRRITITVFNIAVGIRLFNLDSLRERLRTHKVFTKDQFLP